MSENSKRPLKRIHRLIAFCLLAVTLLLLFLQTNAYVKRVERQQGIVLDFQARRCEFVYEWEYDRSGLKLRDDFQESLEYRLKKYIGVDYFYSVHQAHLHRSATDDDISKLSELDTLLEVNLAYCYNISDDGVAAIAGLKNLRKLYLYRNDPESHHNGIPFSFNLETQGRITDKSLLTISKLPNLEELYLYDNPGITDLGLDYLSQCKSLSILDVGGCNVSAKGARLLGQRLPNCKIDI
jgi:Leucine Rich repeat